MVAKIASEYNREEGDDLDNSRTLMVRKQIYNEVKRLIEEDHELKSVV